MSSVGASQVTQFLQSSNLDIDRNGRYDRGELAWGAIKAGAQGKNDIAGVLSTFTLGGKDKKGYVDAYEGGMSNQDLAAFAAKGGDPAAFDSPDFKAANPGNFNESPGSASFSELQQVALEGNRDKFNIGNIFSDNPQPFYSAVGSLLPGAPDLKAPFQAGDITQGGVGYPNGQPGSNWTQFAREKFQQNPAMQQFFSNNGLVSPA